MALNDHTTRVLVALIAIPVIVVLAMEGGWLFFGLVAAISGIALHEFYGLAKAKGASPQVGVGLALGLCVNALYVHTRLQHGVAKFFSDLGIAVPFPTMAQLLLILLLLALPLILVVELFRHKGSAIANIAATVFGVLYVSLLLGSFVGLRELFTPEDFPVYRHFGLSAVSAPESVVSTLDSWGGKTIVAVLASIWICDSAAYYVGRAFGRHKLFERVSPKKTQEGALAGLIFALASFLAAKYLVLPYLSVADALICGGIVGVFGQIGDLCESLLKRDAGVKDSSTLIPGHGGALDRFDSLLFVAPMVFVYVDFVVCS